MCPSGWEDGVMPAVRLAFDVTALHDARTGVGVFAEEVLARVAARDDLDVVAYSASWRGRRDVARLVPANVRVATRRMAAQPLRALWRRIDWPPIDWWTGAVDVVHGPNFVVPPARGAAALATVHDLTCVRFPELCTADVLQYPGLIKRAIARGAHIHTVSSFVRDEVVDEFGIDAARVHVVPNGVSRVDGGDAAAGRKATGGAPYVLAIGTAEPRKDLPTLVRAFADVARSIADVQLVIAGPDGWGADALRDAIAASPVADRIVRIGWVDAVARADLLAGASVFAYPSIYEGFGMPPLEAMAAGVPVVAAAAGAIPEVVGEAAVLIPPRDAVELAAALVDVLTDERERQTLITAGTARVAGYSWDTTATALADVYRALC